MWIIICKEKCHIQGFEISCYRILMNIIWVVINKEYKIYPRHSRLAKLVTKGTVKRKRELVVHRNTYIFNK